MLELGSFRQVKQHRPEVARSCLMTRGDHAKILPGTVKIECFVDCVWECVWVGS